MQSDEREKEFCLETRPSPSSFIYIKAGPSMVNTPKILIDMTWTCVQASINNQGDRKFSRFLSNFGTDSGVFILI